MARTTISDYVIWAKHIHDDPSLAARVIGMRAGETIELEVDGAPGTWRKMDNGKDGRPTPGLRPVGAAQLAWKDTFKRRRGQTAHLVVTAFNPGFADGAESSFHGPRPGLLRSDAERQAALAALMDGARQESRSQDRRLSRDEMHDR